MFTKIRPKTKEMYAQFYNGTVQSAMRIMNDVNKLMDEVFITSFDLNEKQSVCFYVDFDEEKNVPFVRAPKNFFIILKKDHNGFPVDFDIKDLKEYYHLYEEV